MLHLGSRGHGRAFRAVLCEVFFQGVGSLAKAPPPAVPLFCPLSLLSTEPPV